MIAKQPSHPTKGTPLQSEISKGTVVLLHGIGGTSWLMSALAQRLQKERFHVENWGYWSIGQSLNSLTQWFEERLGPLLNETHEPVHIVAHSMGAIISRAVASRMDLPTRSRVVMLSPPNAGSRVATNVGPMLRWLSPAVEELSDAPDSFVNRLPSWASSEVGVIAAETDRVVSETNTHLPGEADHIIVPAGHTALLFREQTADQVVHFLDHGRFHRADCLVCLEASSE